MLHEDLIKTTIEGRVEGNKRIMLAKTAEYSIPQLY